MYYEYGAHCALAVTGLEKVADDANAGYSQYLPGALAVGGAALGGVGGYNLLRRYKPSAIPALKQLQEKAKDLPFQVATHAPTNSMWGRAVRRGLYGAQDISDDVYRAGKAGTKFKAEGTVLHHGDPFSQLPVEGKVNVNMPSEGMTPALADKGSFAKIFKQVQDRPGMPQAIPATEDFGDVAKAFGGDYGRMQAHLKDALPQGFLIKPTDESLGSVGSFINESTSATDPRVARAFRNPSGHVLQEKMPIDKEYRVHTLNGVPFAATHRRAPEGSFRNMWNRASKAMGIGEGGFAHVPVTGEEGKSLMDYVGKVNEPLHSAYEGAATHQAFDVARLPDGTFRLIESNPTPGTFNNPGISRKLQEMATGRMHQDKAMLGAAGLAAGGAAAGYGAGAGINALQAKENT